ncbi:MAG: dienelactone hydrolase family protein [Thermoanaerobaculia bacterium]
MKHKHANSPRVVRLLSILALALVANVATATVASVVASVKATEETIQFKSDGEQASGLLVMPEGKGPFPAVLVIQEWWGVDGWIKDQARALAKEGYLTLAVDLYRGKVADDSDTAHQLMMGLPRERAVRDLKAGLALLRARPDVKPDRVGVIGWCMGGGYALSLATDDPKLAAVVAYYGLPPTDPEAIARITAPVLGNYGADDKGPSPEQARAFEAALKKSGKSMDLKVYPGAGHGFANPTHPRKGVSESSGKDAWARTVAFFAKHLKR